MKLIKNECNEEETFSNHTVFNLFVEPQYSLFHRGIQPQVQIFTGINLQFLRPSE